MRSPLLLLALLVGDALAGEPPAEPSASAPAAGAPDITIDPPRDPEPPTVAIDPPAVSDDIDVPPWEEVVAPRIHDGQRADIRPDVYLATGYRADGVVLDGDAWLFTHSALELGVRATPTAQADRWTWHARARGTWSSTLPGDSVGGDIRGGALLGRRFPDLTPFGELVTWSGAELFWNYWGMHEGADLRLEPSVGLSLVERAVLERPGIDLLVEVTPTWLVEQDRWAFGYLPLHELDVMAGLAHRIVFTDIILAGRFRHSELGTQLGVTVQSGW